MEVTIQKLLTVTNKNPAVILPQDFSSCSWRIIVILLKKDKIVGIV